MSWRTDAKTLGAGIRVTTNDFAHTIHMAADDMATQTGLRGQGFFEIDTLT